MFILLVNFFNHTFNLFINNIVRKPITDESLFCVFYLLIKYFRRGDQFGTGYQVINNCFFISEGAFTFKVEGTGVIIRGFFVSIVSKIINQMKRFF